MEAFGARERAAVLESLVRASVETSPVQVWRGASADIVVREGEGRERGREREGESERGRKEEMERKGECV